MKIIIHSLDELLQLAALVRDGASTTKVGEITQTITVDATAACEALREAVQSATHGESVTVAPHPEGKTVMSSAGPVDANLAEALGITGLPAADSDGAPHNTDWHSEPAKINADGTWRARRKRDEAAYKDWLLSLAVEEAEASFGTFEAEPVATETHALPQDETLHDDAVDAHRLGVSVMDGAPVLVNNVPSEPLPTVDLAALIAGSQEAAENAPDGTIDLLNRGKDFIKEYGTARFEALKAAVAPLEDGTGKPVPSLTPTERRLLRACMDNYPLYV